MILKETHTPPNGVRIPNRPGRPVHPGRGGGEETGLFRGEPRGLDRLGGRLPAE